MHQKESLEFRMRNLEEKFSNYQLNQGAQFQNYMQQQEETYGRKIDHLEDRIRQVNLKFDRIEQLGDRLECLNNLFDQLKTNFDAKLQVYDERLNVVSVKMNKIKNEEFQQLYQLIKKAFNVSKEVQMEMQHIKSRDIRQSEVLLKQSNVLGERMQSPVLHQRIDSYQKNDRIRSITLEKEKVLEQRFRQETEEDDVKSKLKKNESQIQIDKFQFTLQNKGDENQQPKPTLEQSKLISGLLERTISQDHMPRSKYLSSTNHMREQLKNLRK